MNQNQVSTKKITKNKKHLITLLVCVILFAILLPVYFLVIAPMLITETTEEPPPALLPGEVLGSNNRILLFEHVQKADIDSIEVHNEHGSYTFKRDGDNFMVVGMEGAPYSLELLSSLVVSAGYTLSLTRLEEMNDDLSTYGLADADDPAWYVLTKMDGTKHKVYIGDLIPTGGGYYCMYEGREAVYVLDTTLAATLLADVHTILTPSLGYPVSTTASMTVDDLQVIRDGKLLVWIDMIPNESAADGEALVTYEFKHPEQYIPNTSAYSTFIQLASTLTGDEVVLAGNETEDLDPAMIKERFGIDIENPDYLVHYTVTENEVDIETILVFSEPDENGDIYVYSSVFNLVAKIKKENTPTFMSWDLLDFVDDSLFKDSINDVAKLEIQGEINNGNEKLSVDASFTLDGEGQTILVTPNGSGKPYDADDLKNFRQLYIVLVALNLQDYTDLDDISQMDEVATVTITKDDGKTIEFKFYAYNSRRCFYTVNGEGEFYILRDSVEKLLRDTDRLLNGLPIDAYGKN